MKTAHRDYLVEDLGLEVGEIFQIGDGPDAFEAKYLGSKKENGKTYDLIKPLGSSKNLNYILVENKHAQETK